MSKYTAIIAWLLTITFAHSLFAADNPEPAFRHLTINDGLSQSAVYSILEDSRGFLWFGTRFGLNRYDGHEIKVYLYDPLDPSSLPAYFITALCEDRNGMIWVGTQNGGVSRFNPNTQQFTNYRHQPGDPFSLHNNFITRIFEDSGGTIWICTWEGITRYDPETDSFFQISGQISDVSELCNDKILSIAEMPAGTIWLGTENGSLLKFIPDYQSIENSHCGPIQKDYTSSIKLRSILPDPKRNSLWLGMFGEGLYCISLDTEEYTFYGQKDIGTEMGAINGIYETQMDSQGMIWIASTSGLSRYNPERNEYKIFHTDISDPSSLADELLYTLYIDRQGIIWIGTESQGVDRYDPNLVRLSHRKKTGNDNSSLLSDMVFGVSADYNGKVWFSTVGGSFSRLDPATEEYTHYYSPDVNPLDWSVNFINKVLPARNGETWIGTWQCGMYVLDGQTGKMRHYLYFDGDTTTILHNTVYALLEASDGSIWLGSETAGLSRYNPESDNFTSFFYDSDRLDYGNRNFIYALVEDKDGFIWLGTSSGGLYRFDRATESFLNFSIQNNSPKSLTSNCVMSLHEDNSGRIYIGTRSGGLNRLSADRETVEVIDIGDDLRNTSVFGILEDESGYLWLGCNGGIRKVHPESGLENFYTPSDGAINEFYFQSAAKTPDGKMYFGGVTGYNVFHPDSIRNNTLMPEIVLTGLKINYAPVPVGKCPDGRIIIDRDISMTDRLDLNYTDREIEFDFALLNFSASHKNQYAYYLEGFQDDWIYCGTKRTAQFMNLAPGSYTLHVKGANNDGVWSDKEIRLALVISPPFWMTWWFRITVLLLAAGIAGSIISMRFNNLRRQERQRSERKQIQLRMDSQQRELVSKSMDLIAKQDLMEDILGRLKNLKNAPDEEKEKVLRKSISHLTNLVSFNHVWEEFEKWFSEIHSGFISNLRKDIPNLTSKEIKACALLRLNLTSKEIASLMGVEPASVDIYRYRIRKKLGLAKGNNLNEFLDKY